jgi:hypothetical protein
MPLFQVRYSVAYFTQQSTFGLQDYLPCLAVVADKLEVIEGRVSILTAVRHDLSYGMLRLRN